MSRFIREVVAIVQMATLSTAVLSIDAAHVDRIVANVVRAHLEIMHGAITRCWRWWRRVTVDRATDEPRVAHTRWIVAKECARPLVQAPGEVSARVSFVVRGHLDIPTQLAAGGRGRSLHGSSGQAVAGESDSVLQLSPVLAFGARGGCLSVPLPLGHRVHLLLYVSMARVMRYIRVLE